jgi:hypothetical protein
VPGRGESRKMLGKSRLGHGESGRQRRNSGRRWRDSGWRRGRLQVVGDAQLIQRTANRKNVEKSDGVRISVCIWLTGLLRVPG